LDGDINIKFDPALKLVVCKRERNEMINDFRWIYRIILKMLSFHDSGLPVPDDLQSLLDLLNSDDPVKHHQIIHYNMSLLSEIREKVISSPSMTDYNSKSVKIKKSSKKEKKS